MKVVIIISELEIPALVAEALRARGFVVENADVQTERTNEEGYDIEVVARVEIPDTKAAP